MTATQTSYNDWAEVIRNFLKSKRDMEEEKYLKEAIKSVGRLFSGMRYFNDDDIEKLFDSKKYKKDENETSLRFQQRRAKEILCLEKKPDNLVVFSEIKKYLKKCKTINKKYTPNVWLSKNCEGAVNVSFATHVIKLTHSIIDSPSLFDSVSETKNNYLTTSKLKNKVIDGAVSGNQFAPIFQFLELELEGKKLAEVLSTDGQLFYDFYKDVDSNEKILDDWVSGFRQSLESKDLSSHSLAKQIYFPIHTDINKYHLLCNVVSSSLAHVIFNKIFNDQQKNITKAKEKNKFSSEVIVNFPKRSNLNVTASNHSNASQLNGKRGGKLHLFSCQPPSWQSQLKPPVTRKSLFDNLYNDTIRTEVDYLRDFLLRFKHLDLSIKDPKRKKHLDRWVNNIVDEFLFYIASIQNLTPGWSATEGIRLKTAHQYLLDPYRLDESFQAERNHTNWKTEICADFARWLNYQLRGKDPQFTPKSEHAKLWKKAVEKPLREYMQIIENEVNQVMESSL